MAANIIRPRLFKALSSPSLAASPSVSASPSISASQLSIKQLFRCLSTTASTLNSGIFAPKEFTVEGHLNRMLKDETNEVSLQVITQSPYPVQSEQRLIDTMTLKVRSSDEAVLESYTQFVQRAANIFEMNSSGKIVLPMFVDKRTVNKSTHGNKQHRYQYELRTHGRGIKIWHVTGDTTDLFLEYIQRMKPEGVSLSVESTELETMPQYLQPPMQDDLGVGDKQKEEASPFPSAHDLM